jgi:hypothetical protein
MLPFFAARKEPAIDAAARMVPARVVGAGAPLVGPSQPPIEAAADHPPG